MDPLYRVVIGAPVSKREWRVAFAVVAVWIVIDLIQFTSWAIDKVYPPAVICVTK
jgi:hypothetical protein